MAVVFGVVGLFERRIVVIGDAKQLSAVGVAVTRACEIQETGQERPFRIAMRFEVITGATEHQAAARRQMRHLIGALDEFGAEYGFVVLLKRFVELVEHRWLNHLPGKRVVYEIPDGRGERRAKRQREGQVLLDGVVPEKNALGGSA